VVIIRKSLQIRMIIPDRLPPRDEEGRFISEEDAKKTEKEAQEPGSQDIMQLLWNVVIHPAMRQYIQQANPGMVMGPFNPQGGILDYLDDQRFQALQTEIMRAATSRDPALKATIKGIHEKLGIQGASLAGVQPEKIQEMIGLLAPVLMRHSPKLWDQLHGPTGSKALLESQLSQMFRYTPGMTDNMITQKSQELADNLMSGVGQKFGLTGYELGQFFQNASKQGIVNPSMATPAIMSALEAPAGLLAATRDVLAPQGITDFSSYMQAAAAAARSAGYDYERAERDLRMGSYMQQGGGMLNRALGLAGQSIRGGSLDTMNAMNQKLIAQGLSRRVGNMVSAAARAVGLGIAKSGSKLAQFVNAAKQGKLDPFTGAQWQQMMLQSGVSPSTVASLLSQPAENVNYVMKHFPTIPIAIRMNQAKFDHGPVLDAINKKYAKNPHRESLIRGAKREAAKKWGYGNLETYESQHGPGTKYMMDVIRDAEAYADSRRGTTNVGRSDPLERFVGWLQTPGDNTLAGGARAFANILDPEQISKPTTPAKPPAMPKPATVSSVPLPGSPAMAKAPGMS